MTLDRVELLALLKLVDVTEPQEIDCSELLHRIAAFVEGFDAAGAPPPQYEDVVQHLRVCPECLEEFEVLLRMYRDGDLESMG